MKLVPTKKTNGIRLSTHLIPSFYLFFSKVLILCSSLLTLFIVKKYGNIQDYGLFVLAFTISSVLAAWSFGTLSIPIGILFTQKNYFLYGLARKYAINFYKYFKTELHIYLVCTIICGSVLCIAKGLDFASILTIAFNGIIISASSWIKGIFNLRELRKQIFISSITELFTKTSIMYIVVGYFSQVSVLALAIAASISTFLIFAVDAYLLLNEKTEQRLMILLQKVIITILCRP